MESKIAQIKSELIQLSDGWVKSAHSKMNTAKKLYPTPDGQSELWESKSLNMAAICELTCARSLQSILAQMQA